MISLSKEHSGNDNAVVSSAPCKTIVFYDDVRSRERVLQLSDYLVPQFWEDFQFEISWWRANFINNSVFHETIIKELVEADIIIFALSSGYEITQETKETLEFLMGFRVNNDGLLVMALIPNHGSLDGYNNIHNYLATLARRNQMDYLSEWQIQLESGQMDIASKRFGTPDALPPTEGQHWGINE